jgi:viroplasmin and RNaseH domain-containing protein
MYTAGYGDSPTEPTEQKSFETREEAQAWLDEIIPTLPEQTLVSEEIPETVVDGNVVPAVPAVYECSWCAWISNDDA